MRRRDKCTGRKSQHNFVPMVCIPFSWVWHSFFLSVHIFCHSLQIMHTAHSHSIVSIGPVSLAFVPSAFICEDENPTLTCAQRRQTGRQTDMRCYTPYALRMYVCLCVYIYRFGLPHSFSRFVASLLPGAIVCANIDTQSGAAWKVQMNHCGNLSEIRCEIWPNQMETNGQRPRDTSTNDVKMR